MPTHDPSVEIDKKNPWYTNNQFKEQLSRYRHIIEERWQFFRKIINQFLKNKRKDKLQILDAGCGDGINLICLLEFREYAEIYAGDYNPLRLQRVEKKFNNKENIINVHSFNLLHNEISEKKFDIILLSQVLEHIEKDDMVLRNLYRMLNPQGILILGTPNEGCILAQIRNNFINPRISKTTDHVNFYREPIIREKIENANFRILDFMYNGPIIIPHQYLHILLTSTNIGYKVFRFFGKIFRSQVAGYYFACLKE